MKPHRIYCLAVLIFVMSISPHDAALATVIGQVKVSLYVASGCQINDNLQANGNINDFGTLNFGHNPPLWSAPLTTELSASGHANTLEVMCSPGLGAFSISVDGGLRGNRTLLRDGGTTQGQADTIGYGLFQDASRTAFYAINTPRYYPIPASGQPVPIRMHGVIPANAIAKASGRFSDTLRITIDF